MRGAQAGEGVCKCAWLQFVRERGSGSGSGKAYHERQGGARVYTRPPAAARKEKERRGAAPQRAECLRWGGCVGGGAQAHSINK